MLVISRKVHEGIIIDENIEIVVLGIEDGKVKLGIEAPKEKKIFRKEILEGIKKSNLEAANVDKNIVHSFFEQKGD